MNHRLPGDELVPNPSFVINRRMVLPAPPERVWPWLVQLGKERAGWYLPRWIEVAIPPRRRSARRVLSQYQQLEVGQDVPDWGPGRPVFRVAALDAPNALVYLSRRDRTAAWGWPATDAFAGVLTLSWALVLQPDPRGTELRIRLRVRRGSDRGQWLVRQLGGLIDWLTIVGLRQGLIERLRDAEAQGRSSER